MSLQLHLGQNGPLSGKSWATQLLKEVAALRVHFSLWRRKMQVSATILFTLVATVSRAEWKVISAQTESSSAPGLEHRYVVSEDSTTGERVSTEFTLFSAKSFSLRIVDQPAESRIDLAEAMRREKCLAGVNGGYFDPDYKPIGLLIADGKVIAPLQRARLLSGVLSASPSKIQISRVGEFSGRQKIDSAVECGPMIVDLGRAVRGLEATRLARRTFAAVGAGDRAALGFCSEITLADLANILAPQVTSGFKIQRALNLDGGSSSAFWFRRKDGSAFSIPEQKTVRDFIAVMPR